MSNLNFISDEVLRALIERDKLELDQCAEHGLYKSILLLSGSIIEAILVDCFLLSPKGGLTEKEALEAPLATLIDKAEKSGFISARTREISTVIREYRNLIHPGREYRLHEKVNKNTAAVAANLVEIIIEEVSESKEKRIGYTAEEAINKIKVDPTCTPLFPDMISRMSPSERVKLFRVIPYTKAQTIYERDSLTKMHEKLKEDLPQRAIREGVIAAYQDLSGLSQREALAHLRFYINDLTLLDDSQKQVILAYLLNVLENTSIEDLGQFLQWGIFHPLGDYLDDLKLGNESGVNALKRVIVERAKAIATEEKATIFENVLKDIILRIDDRIIYVLLEQLKEYNKRTSDELSSRWIERWSRRIDSIHIPF